MKIGDEFRSRIDASIPLHDRLLLILSVHSIKSRWVQKEVGTAFEKEEKDDRLALFPNKILIINSKPL
jgi:TIR domain